ncbi:MAG TPA: protoporphyrinogen oxidase [Candidatus Binataceae bacterium]|nr:protoporphyrinogen oxidase [Candidatus Binataceae bacterium]
MIGTARADRPRAQSATIAVIGGGITGLAAANHLLEVAAANRARPLTVALFERAEKAGGKLATVRRAGFLAESGPDCFLGDKPGASGLIDRFGLSDTLIPVQEQNRKSYILHSKRLHEIPDGLMMGAPTRLSPMLASPLFSTVGKLRIALEPLVARRGIADDESLAHFIERHFGRQLLERLVGPLIGGIFGGDPHELSARATMPQMVELERQWRSLALALRAARPRQRGATGRRPSMLTLRGGMQTLSDALIARLAAVVHSGTEVTAIRRDSGRWRLSMAGGGEFFADAVICAAPAWITARLCRTIDKDLAELLGSIHYNSVATVNLGYNTMPACRLPAGTGFVTSRDDQRLLTAVSFSSAKFENRAPRGGLLVRAFFGDGPARELTEAELLDRARRELADILGLVAAPVLTHVSRLIRAMPCYGVGHQQRVARAEARAAALEGFILAGAAYRGVGVPDCIISGEAAARRAYGAVYPE